MLGDGGRQPQIGGPRRCPMFRLSGNAKSKWDRVLRSHGAFDATNRTSQLGDLVSIFPPHTVGHAYVQVRLLYINAAILIGLGRVLSSRLRARGAIAWRRERKRKTKAIRIATVNTSKKSAKNWKYTHTEVTGDSYSDNSIHRNSQIGTSIMTKMMWKGLRESARAKQPRIHRLPEGNWVKRDYQHALKLVGWKLMGCWAITPVRESCVGARF